MPKHSSRRSSGQISHRQENTSSPSRPRTVNPVDHPLASADPDLNGSVVDMRTQNEKRLRDALNRIAAPQPTVQEPHHAGHAVSLPKLSFGMDNVTKAGSWYQTCSPVQNGCYAHYITDPPDSDLVFGDSELGNYMRIRQELAQPSKRRAIPEAVHQTVQTCGQIRPARSTLSATQSDSQTAAQGIPQVIPPALPQAIPSSRPFISIPNADLLDAALPVAIMAWIENWQSPVHAEAYARRTRRLHLSDFKMHLGAVGLEKGPSIEVYTGRHGWIPIRWDTPYPIQAAGDIVLIRVQGVTQLADWEAHAPFIV